MCLGAAVLVGCRPEAPAIDGSGVPRANGTTHQSEEVELPATRQLGKKLHGSIFSGTGEFGGGPEFSDAELQQVVAQLPAGISKINLKMTLVSDAGLAALRGADQITEVYLPPRITDGGLEHIAGMKNLTFLILEDAQVSGQGLSHLRGMPNLKRLFLNGAAVTDSGLANIVGLDALEELDLTNAQITDAALPHLMQLPRLKSLDLTGSHVTRQAVAAFQKARPEIVVNGP